MTFVLVSAVYAVAIGQPSFGIVGPLVIGMALWGSALVGGLAASPPPSLKWAFECPWEGIMRLPTVRSAAFGWRPRACRDRPSTFPAEPR